MIFGLTDLIDVTCSNNESMIDGFYMALQLVLTEACAISKAPR